MAETLKQWLADGPFALGMSSGFFGFFAHCGVLGALEEEGFLPERVAGSSAGALVTASWAAGVPVATLTRELRELRRSDFWDPAPGWGLLAGRRFRQRLNQLLPVHRFEECPVPAAVSVYDLERRTVRVLDRGLLAPAIHASCAVPGMFHPVQHEGGRLVDGGVADRPGLTGLREAPRVLFHHLASRSPWRRRAGRSMQVPRREGQVTLVIEGLPRVGPYRLPEGVRAMEEAREATLRALSEPLIAEEVRVTARRRRSPGARGGAPGQRR